MSYEKLGFISNQILKAEHLNHMEDGIANAGGAGIINVVELPTENIREDVFYRSLKGTFVLNRDKVSYFTCRCVQNLPEIGEPVTFDMENFVFYYNAQDGDVYGYATAELAQSAGLSAGWYPITLYAQIGEFTWGGVITEIMHDPQDDAFRLLLDKDYYIYQNGWCKVSFAYEKLPKFDIIWDGNMTNRVVLDMSSLGYENTYYVKVSDDVFTHYDILGSYFEATDGTISGNVHNDDIDSETYPGALIISSNVVIVYDDVTLAAALGIPAGIYTNGVYFWLHTEYGYTSRFVGYSEIVKIDSKFLDINDTDFISCSQNQDLSDYNQFIARNNINVYSKLDVDNKLSTLASECLLKSGGTMSGELILSANPTNDLCATTKQYVDNKLSLDQEEIVLPHIYDSCMCYGEGKFVAICSTNNLSQFTCENIILYSEDGVNWNTANLNGDARLYNIRSIIYCDGKFVAVGVSGIVIYSQDGINWDCINVNSLFSVDNSRSVNMQSVCYGNGKFVSSGDIVTDGVLCGVAMLYSEDGINWNHSDLLTYNNVRSICYGNGKFVSVAYNSSNKEHHFIYSEDGVNWSESTCVIKKNVTSICYGNGKFVALENGSSSLTNPGALFYSEDGVNWSEATLPLKSNWHSVIYDNGKFIAINENPQSGFGDVVLYSEDGVNWSKAILPTIACLSSVCYGNKKFVAIGVYQNAIYSEDGINWSNKTGRTILVKSNTDVTQEVFQAISPYLILISPNNTQFKIIVSDDGILSATPVTT